MKMETVTGIKGKARHVNDHKPKVLMLLTNPFLPDPRVLKEACSLSRLCEVTVWALDREGKFPSCEDKDGIRIERVSLPFLQGLRPVMRRLHITLFIDLVLFYLRSLQLMEKDFQIVHSHDLDTLLLGVLIGKAKRAKVIFDAHEDFAAGASFHKGDVIVCSLLGLERSLMRLVDAVIVVGEIMKDEYRKRTKKPIHVIGNWKNPQEFRQASLSLVNPRAKEAKDHGKLIVSYLAGIAQNRILLPLIEAAKEDPDVFIIVTGGRKGEPLTARVERAMANLSNGLYLGWLDQDELNSYFSFSDVVYYCLRPDAPNNRFSASNTVFSALAARKAVVTTEIGEVGRIVKTGNCGVVMSEATKEEILVAFAKLKDRNSLQMLQENASRTAHSYSWARAEENLLVLYEKLLEEKR